MRVFSDNTSQTGLGEDFSQKEIDVMFSRNSKESSASV